MLAFALVQYYGGSAFLTGRNYFGQDVSGTGYESDDDPFDAHDAQFGMGMYRVADP